MQQTLAFAPTDDDLQEFYFDMPVITLGPLPDPEPETEAQVEPEGARAS
jgi:hypothetical protein